MGMIPYISTVVVLCFTVSLFNAISGDTNIDCTTLDNTTCCDNPGCFYINCSEKTNSSIVHEGCHNNNTEVDAVCVAKTVVHVCDGPAEGTCEALTTNVTCCNNDDLPECAWISCIDAKTGKNHQGCHNSTGAMPMCKGGKFDNTCPAAPVEETCKDYLKNQTACCDHSDKGCIFVTCTNKTKKFDGCYLNTEVTCTSKIDQCDRTTVGPTTQPTAKPTFIPLFQECQLYNDSQHCCSETYYSCIRVNCTGGGITYQGCYSKSNETEIKAACSTSYLDTCAATTPVPPTTAAPSPGKKTGRHFDGASFIGGIVLCAGIVLIIFFGIKWYKSRRGSNNYHQM